MYGPATLDPILLALDVVPLALGLLLAICHLELKSDYSLLLIVKDINYDRKFFLFDLGNWFVNLDGVKDFIKLVVVS